MKYPELAKFHSEKKDFRRRALPESKAPLIEYPRWPEEYLARIDAYQNAPPKQEPKGCTFTKSCTLPPGIINHEGRRAPLESLTNYGDWSVLSFTAGQTAGQTLTLLGGSLSSETLAARLGGSLSLRASATGAAALGAPLFVGVAALLFPSSLGDGTRDSAFYGYDQYSKLDSGRTRVRIGFQHLPDGSINAYGVYTGRRDWEMAKVVRAEERDGAYIANLGHTELVWIPDADFSGTLVTPPPDTSKIPHIWVYPDGKAIEEVMGEAPEPTTFDDFIVWFPGEVAAPIYIIIERRTEPGVVSGRGQDIPGLWLAGAGSGSGVPIPTRIADRLNGKSFGSFDKFREAFWKEVAADAELSEQFSVDNRRRMADGRAPFTSKVEKLGKRQNFELHHLDEISKGGSVYNIDNIHVTTPKNHIEIHRNLHDSN